MQLKTQRQDQGIVALITVIIASILFTIVVVAMVGVINSEQRQASEADLSNRAYFAAESGVEAGLLKIKTALASTNPAPLTALANIEGHCLNGGDPNTDPSGVGYTCLYMTHVANSLQSSLQADGDAYQVDLSSISNIGKIVISWHKPGLDGASYSLIPKTSGINQLFKGGVDWHYPALLEVQSILFSAGASSYNANDTSQLKILESALAPVQGGAGTTSENDSTVSSGSSSAPLEADCTPAGTSTASGYACTETINITDPSDYRRILRLRSRYAGTNFNVQVYQNGSATPVNVPDSFETIDVTAKAGDTYRRVRAKVAITQGTIALDYALFSDTNICHNFDLRDSRSGNASFGNVNDSNVGSCPF